MPVADDQTSQASSSPNKSRNTHHPKKKPIPAPTRRSNVRHVVVKAETQTFVAEQQQPGR